MRFMKISPSKFFSGLSVFCLSSHSMDGADFYYRGWIQSATRKLQDKPLIGMIGTVVEDYEYLWDNYYFSTTAL